MRRSFGVLFAAMVILSACSTVEVPPSSCDAMEENCLKECHTPTGDMHTDCECSCRADADQCRDAQ